jgi:hypothetical protein
VCAWVESAHINNEEICMNKYIIINIVIQYVKDGLKNINDGLKVYG